MANISGMRSDVRNDEIKLGSFFAVRHTNNIYILGKVDYNGSEDLISCCLVGLSDGNRFNNPLWLGSCFPHEQSFTPSEINRIFGKVEWLLIGNYNDFVAFIKKGGNK